MAIVSLVLSRFLLFTVSVAFSLEIANLRNAIIYNNSVK